MFSSRLRITSSGSIRRFQPDSRGGYFAQAGDHGTLLHELCHHLDYHALKLADSLHTEGFFRRESDLFRQLVPESPRVQATPRAASARAQTRSTARPQAEKSDKERAPAAGSRQGRLDFGSSAER